MDLPAPYVWRTVNKREWPATGYERHILPHKGALTSLCGTTAIPHTVWRAPTVQKPDCAECVRNLPHDIPRPSARGGQGGTEPQHPNPGKGPPHAAP